MHYPRDAKVIVMDFLRHSDKLDSVVPGVTEAYRRLRASHGQGIYTSLGRYYNHTLFGRDGGMTAKFVSDFDHQVVHETIITLASHQGMSYNPVTQEQPGRIHHELRDYAAWQGRWYDRIGLWAAGRAWGMHNRKLLTYYAADTTATYIRLVHKYAARIDASILDRQVPRADGSIWTVRESVTAAADWIASQVDDEGIMLTRRTNRLSLPYQIFADSVTAYAWRDGKLADASRAHSYVEAQGYGIDALQDAARIMPSEPNSRLWRDTAERMYQALFDKFWNDNEHIFAPALFERDGNMAQLDTEMITAGWTLNTSFWTDTPNPHHRAKIIRIVTRLFRDDFLTDAGLRTRSKRTHEPLGDTIDYHGSQTVWPMFNFMVVEGLRRHGLYRLARQLEARLINSINAVGDFPEFIVVDHDGKLYRPDKSSRIKRHGQMIPEQHIAFTVVPALTLAYRHSYPRTSPADSGWQYDLESEILATIPNIEVLEPSEAAAQLNPTPLRISRTVAGFASAWRILPIFIRRPR